MAALESSIRALLRPSDEVKVVLEAIVVNPLSNAGTPDSPLSPTRSQTLDDNRNKRILAVVAHSDGPNTQEEGSVFILKSKPADRAFDQSDILRVFPVFGGFSITMAQVRRETWPTAQSSPSLTIKQGDIEGLEPLTLCTQHVQTLRDVLAGMQAIEGNRRCATCLGGPTHNVFVAGAVHIEACSITCMCVFLENGYELIYDPELVFSVPQDLRVAQKPLHTRLSLAFAGEAGDDSTDIVRIRDEWIRGRVRETCSQGKQSLRIRIGTFNVNGSPPSQDLSTWVGGNVNQSRDTIIPPLKEISPLSIGEVAKNPFDDPANSSSAEPARILNPELESVPTPALDKISIDVDADLLVLGFQELDLSTEALLYSTSTFREDAWCTAVFAALGAQAENYEKLVSKQLVGILLVVIVRKALRPCFSEIKSTAAGTGIMGLMGNKGGTAIRLKFTPIATDALENPGPTVLTFVNAHLAAFDEMVDKRHADFHDLTKRLRFDLGTDGTVPVPCSIFESDVLFWMIVLRNDDGSAVVDLNYRLDLADADVRTILSSEEWAESRYETLLRYDQLKSAARANKAFDMFSEGPITHLPTYRFNAGLLKDDLGYDLKRRPAWTDRVLFTSSAFAPIKQLSYTSHPQITQSDHRPVSAEFNIEIDLYDLPAAEAAADKLYRQLNGLEDAHEDTNARVNLKIMNASVNLGKVYYKKTVTQQVGIRNIGKVPCAYRLVPIDPESSIHPDWLRALLLPDELTYITLTAYIDNDSASRLNIDHKELECTLILHTVMGKDHFIAITAEYVPTCFANRISRLTLLPGPVRSLKSPSELRAEDRAINAPREIMRLVNWMMGPDLNLVKAFENVFVSPADETAVDTIRECLDTGADFPFSPDPKDDKAVVAFGETLFRLLDSLPEPLIPVQFHARCSEVADRGEAFEMLEVFPPTTVNVWISVTAFLHFVCQSSGDHDTKTTRISSLFAPVLLRDTANLVSPVGRRKFLLYFIM
ncbi:Inositol polyphosphate 5-phosphatase OCRL-1 [Mycena sanguinolenta]|uniref:Inositol polyphosphate 5-phosphatase OCRL-1 n=1 Tax=Mycena sanguinolenta TaxID=230812 RepID=A0A8H6XXF1_9AGAR|nr:Inositol polyphosphate 5-phosphatase OCRL-1 [Mycena sanguinolenta]